MQGRFALGELGKLLVCCERFGDAKVNYFNQRLAVNYRNQHIAWLNVTVDRPFLMCMLNSKAYLHHQMNLLLDVQPSGTDIIEQQIAWHILHSDVMRTGIGHTRIDDPGDIRVFHVSKCLLLALETL